MRWCAFGWLMISVVGYVALGSGCASYKAQDVYNIKVSVEPSRKTRLSNVSVLRKNDVMQIRGVVRPASVTTCSTGHVDIRLHDARRNVVRALKVRPSSSTFVRKGVQKRVGKPRFHASVPDAGESISEVQLIPHNVPFDACDLVRE